MLSKICIFVVWNNNINFGYPDNNVVNCFQKFVSLLSETTTYDNIKSIVQLWIAFKNLYLCCLKQPLSSAKNHQTSCELLSKICIFVVWNNRISTGSPARNVVNCFQKFVSLLSETTYLYFPLLKSSCELLSKICIFVVWNNFWWGNNMLKRVVNCFQKFVSLLSETTADIWAIASRGLWIAFKNLYLCCLKQRALLS